MRVSALMQDSLGSLFYIERSENHPKEENVIAVPMPKNYQGRFYCKPSSTIVYIFIDLSHLYRAPTMQHTLGLRGQCSA